MKILNYFKQKLKNFPLNKAIALFTTACFVISIVCSQTIYAAIPLPNTLPIKTDFNNIPKTLIPFNLGRVTDAYFSNNKGDIVINIQDLHSHEQTQQNIYSILSILDDKFGITDIYLEGASSGSINIQWLSNIKDSISQQKVLNNLLNSGRLSGGEYFAVKSNKNIALKGLEDNKIYSQNFEALNNIYNKETEIKNYISLLNNVFDKKAEQYYSKENEKINKIIQSYTDGKISKSNFVLQKKLIENKKNMSTQLGEVSKAISNMADEIEKDIKSKDKFENKKREIISLLAQTNVKIEDVIIKKNNNGKITVDVHSKGELQNSQKEKINKVVSNVLKEKLVISNAQEANTVRLTSEDKFLVTVGMAKATKKGNVVSGDNMLKGKLQDGKYIFAISDGMGSGEDANKSSGLALSMLEKLLSSGFDKDTSVELINGALLNSSEKEIFATLDIAIADLHTGNIEFLKNGACPTYIKNKKRINLVKSVTLPTGIIDKVDQCLYDKDIETGDILVMCSDGILDSNVEYKNKELWVKYLLEDIETDDAQKIADLILNEAIDNNFGVAKDDMSVIVCKFIQK